MTRRGIEPRFPGPLANTLLIRPMARLVSYNRVQNIKKLYKNVNINTQSTQILNLLT